MVSNISFMDRFYGAWWGAFIGDAMAMPSHGYSSEEALFSDYGKIDEYKTPKSVHPTSVLHSLPTYVLPEKFDYIGDKRRKLWATYKAHPHCTLEAGENTLPLFLALHLAFVVASGGKFDLDAWVERYESIMTTPDVNRDVFIPSIHRRYFENRAAGKTPEKNGVSDAHMSDIAIFFPMLFFTRKNAAENQMNLYRALEKFTVGEGASTGAYFLSELLTKVLKGETLEDAIYKNMTPDRHVSLAFPYRRWIKNHSDKQAIDSIGCLAAIEEGIPLSIYVALKYGNNVAEAVKVNANIGGETTGRGAIIGMLSGAQCGLSSIPRNYIDGLKYNSEIQAVGEMLWQLVR